MTSATIACGRPDFRDRIALEPVAGARDSPDHKQPNAINAMEVLAWGVSMRDRAQCKSTTQSGSGEGALAF